MTQLTRTANAWFIVVWIAASACGPVTDAAMDGALPDTVKLPAGEACPACTISLDTLGPTIGGVEDSIGVRFSDVNRMEVDDAGGIWLSPGTDDGRIVRYDGRGRPVEFARPGEGPGEFEDVGGLELEGDSALWVWADRLIQLVRYSGGEIISETPNHIQMDVNSMLSLGERRFVLVGWPRVAGPICANCSDTQPINPLWLASFDSAGTLATHRPIEDFEVLPVGRYAFVWGNIPVAASRHAGGFWVAAIDSIAVTHRDSTGAVRKVLAGAAEWFPEWGEDAPIPPVIVEWVNEDEQGRVWLVIEGDPAVLWDAGRLRRASWGEPPASEDRPASPMLNRLSAVIVIDPDDGVVLLERALPVRLLGRNGGPLAILTELPRGEQTITPVRLVLTGR